MPKPKNPTSFIHQLTPEQQEWVQSIHKILSGSVDLGVPMGSISNTFGINSGVYSQFGKGNGSGTLVRVAAHGVSGTGAPYSWPAAGGLAIDHQLGHQPIGFHVVDSDKDVRVFRTAAPDTRQITVEPTDTTASVTLYIF